MLSCELLLVEREMPHSELRLSRDMARPDGGIEARVCLSIGPKTCAAAAAAASMWDVDNQGPSSRQQSGGTPEWPPSFCIRLGTDWPAARG